MTRHAIRQPTRSQRDREAGRAAARRESDTARLSPDSRVTVLTDPEVAAFTGDATGQRGYVRTLAEALAHAWATGTATNYVDHTGALIVAVDAAGVIVERGPGRL